MKDQFSPQDPPVDVNIEYNVALGDGYRVHKVSTGYGVHPAFVRGDDQKWQYAYDMPQPRYTARGQMYARDRDYYDRLRRLYPHRAVIRRAVQFRLYSDKLPSSPMLFPSLGAALDHWQQRAA